MKTLAAAVVLLGLGVPGTSFAQDRPLNLTGFYVGAYGGIGWGYAQATNDANVTTGTGDAPGGFDDGNFATRIRMVPHGLIGGGLVGYNRQWNRIVAGVEAEAGYLNLSAFYSEAGTNPPNGFADDDEGAVNYGWYGALSVRVGMMFDGVLLFAKVGGIVTQYDTYFADLDAGVIDPSDLAVLANPQFGVLAGAGFELPVNDRLSLRAEYNYFHLGNDVLTNDDGDAFLTHNTGHLVKIGVAFRFGG